MKALVVSTTPRDDVHECLSAAGSSVTVAPNGEEAIRCAEHATFDMAVIVSTGEQMDTVETYLNIRELKPSMDIVLLTPKSPNDEESTADRIATWFARTHALTLDEFAEFLQHGVLGSRR